MSIPAVGSLWQCDGALWQVAESGPDGLQIERVDGEESARAYATALFQASYEPVVIGESCPACGSADLHIELRDPDRSSFPPSPSSYGAWIICSSCGRSFRQPT